MAGLTAFMLVLFLGVFITVFGLPGTVLILIDVLIYALLTGFVRVGFMTIFILALISIMAELIDFGVGMAGAVRFGSSRAGIWSAVFGGFAGAIILAPWFLGIGVLLGIFLGGGISVFVMEMLRRRKLKPAFRASIGAVLGRMTGITVKGLLAVMMVAITLHHIYS